MVQNQDNNFLESNQFNLETFISTYSLTLANQRYTINKLTKDLEIEKARLLLLQKEYGERYKIAIVKKYMSFWSKSGKFPMDDELTKVVFYIGGLDIETLDLDCSNKIPKTELKLNNNTFCFKYYNDRLEAWMELKP